MKQSQNANGQKLVFLFDVDNTLIDNDAVTAVLREHLEREVGNELALLYWEYLEELRSELGYADYLGALQRFRRHYPHEHGIVAVSLFLIDYPFEQKLYPNALQAIEHVKPWGDTVILTDGDVVFQPHKVHRSGLQAAVQGRVLVYVHKDEELADIESRFPADHYVVIDDKMKILSRIKQSWNSRVTTVFVEQGRYAHAAHLHEQFGEADITLGAIGELLAFDERSFTG